MFHDRRRGEWLFEIAVLADVALQLQSVWHASSHDQRWHLLPRQWKKGTVLPTVGHQGESSCSRAAFHAYEQRQGTFMSHAASNIFLFRLRRTEWTSRNWLALSKRLVASSGALWKRSLVPSSEKRGTRSQKKPIWWAFEFKVLISFCFRLSLTCRFRLLCCSLSRTWRKSHSWSALPKRVSTHGLLCARISSTLWTQRRYCFLNWTGTLLNRKCSEDSSQTLGWRDGEEAHQCRRSGSFGTG